MDWLEEALFGSDDDAPPPGVNEDPSFVETEPSTTGSSSTTHGRRIDPIDTSTGDDDRSPPTPPSNTPSVNYTDKTTVPSTLTPAFPVGSDFYNSNSRGYKNDMSDLNQAIEWNNYDGARRTINRIYLENQEGGNPATNPPTASELFKTLGIDADAWRTAWLKRVDDAEGIVTAPSETETGESEEPLPEDHTQSGVDWMPTQEGGPGAGDTQPGDGNEPGGPNAQFGTGPEAPPSDDDDGKPIDWSDTVPGDDNEAGGPNAQFQRPATTTKPTNTYDNMDLDLDLEHSQRSGKHSARERLHNNLISYYQDIHRQSQLAGAIDGFVLYY